VLVVAVMVGCQSLAIDGPKGEPQGSQDIIESLAQLPDVQVLQYSADGVPQFIVGNLGRVDVIHEAGLLASDASLRAAMEPILKVFRLEGKDLVLRKVNIDEVGWHHYRYYQQFKGMDVVGGDLVVHVDVAGAITGANGTARGDISPALGVIAIAESAANVNIANDARWASMSGLVVTATRMVYIRALDGVLRKAYEQTVEGVRGQDPVRDLVYVDVENGAIVEVHPQIQHVRNRMTYNANNGTTLPGTLKRTETQAATGDVAVDEAHVNAGDVYDMYNFFWNRNGIDNAGMTLTSSVHYSTNYCNAFWNSTQMTYGDGNASVNCFPLTRSVDVAAHEMTHGITEHESALVYSGEPGGLNESLSDVWGAGIEAYVLGGRNGTLSIDPKVFLIGDEVIPPALRYMCDPAADGVSADVWSANLGNLDVHYSSGPNNLVFCLLTKGGTHPRGKTTVPVPAIGMEKTLRLMYQANVNLLTSNSDYAAMRTAMVQAAQQLGYNQAIQDSVACAYAAIKVGSAPLSCGWPQISAPSSLAFGKVEVGKTSGVQALSVTNIGTTLLVISDASLVAGAADYVVTAGTTGPQTTMIQPASSVTWNLACSPTPQGAGVGTFRILSNSATQSTTDVSLSCTRQRVQFGPNVIDLGLVAAGTTVTLEDSITVTNLDEAHAFHLQRIVVDGPRFEVLVGEGDEIAQQTTRSFAVRFSPDEEGDFEATATLFIDEDPEPQATVVLRGRAYSVSVHGGGGCTAGRELGGGSVLLLFAALAAGRRRRAAPTVVALAVLSAGGTAVADDVRVGAFHPVPATSGVGFQLESAEVGDRGDWVASGVFSFATNPMVVDASLQGNVIGEVRPISRRMMVELGGAYAFLGRFEAGLQMPFYSQSGRGPSGETMLEIESASGAALGDLTLHAKSRLVRAAWLTAGVALHVTLPTSTTGRFTGIALPSVRVLGLATFMPTPRLTLAFNGGPVLRKTAVYRDEVFIEQGSGLSWGAGATLRLGGKLSVTGEVFGELLRRGRDRPRDLERARRARSPRHADTVLRVRDRGAGLPRVGAGRGCSWRWPLRQRLRW